MPQRSRIVELWLIAGAFCVVTAVLWGLGRALDEPLLSFAGLMTLGSTFVPMPADAYVVNASTFIDPVTVGLLGGGINALAVLGERAFLERLIGFPIFERLNRFVGNSRFVDALESQMFIGLTVAAASPLPFEVFRFVACARGYNRTKYAIATFVGRGARYYVLALGTSRFVDDATLPWIVGSLVAFFAIGLVQSIRRFRKGERELADGDPAGQATPSS